MVVWVGIGNDRLGAVGRIGRSFVIQLTTLHGFAVWVSLYCLWGELFHALCLALHMVLVRAVAGLV